jgi:hypothetical protein
MLSDLPAVKIVPGESRPSGNATVRRINKRRQETYGCW